VSATVRVLVVDDSPTVRRVLRRVVESAGGLEVVGEAGDGEEGVRLTLELEPDAIIMDLDMPRMDGYQAIEEIRRRRPTPVVVVTARQERDQMREAFKTMRRGVLAVFPKPEVPEGWVELQRVLPETLLHVGGRGPDGFPGEARTGLPDLVRVSAARHLRTIGIGASTGGPAALREVLAALGRGFGAGVVVVQHIAAGFEVGLVDWLAHELGLDVALAADGEILRPGTVRVAPAGAHLRVDAERALRLEPRAVGNGGHCPSVDELFCSLAAADPRSSAAALLTGMGSDGARGMLALHRAGGLTVVQDAASCAVFGMPRAAVEIGAAELLLTPGEIGALLRTACERPWEQGP
jgi:two-component system chemotaxis response regulator CheB